MAGLIPQSFIDNMLDRVDIVEVVDHRVKLKKAGKNLLKKKGSLTAALYSYWREN